MPKQEKQVKHDTRGYARSMREVIQWALRYPYGKPIGKLYAVQNHPIYIRPKCWGRLHPDLNTMLLQCRFANLSLGSNRAANASASGVPG